MATSGVTLTEEQVAELQKSLSDLRHNVNNHLSMIVAAIELIARKPETTARMVDAIGQQPTRILIEVKRFSDHLEGLIGRPRQ